MNGKTLLGIALTAVVLFFFGFVYWALNPLPYTAMQQVSDPAAAQSTLAAVFPDSGIYSIPGPGNDPSIQELYAKGPTALLTIDHTPEDMTTNMIKGFLHMLLSGVLLAVILRKVAGTAARLKTAALLGFTATFIINGGEIVWWQQPTPWILYQMVYHVLFFVIAALVLDRFLPRER